MNRVSYERNRTVIIQEGLSRPGFYFYEAKICTADTDTTISSIVQKGIMERQEGIEERMEALSGNGQYETYEGYLGGAAEKQMDGWLKYLVR